MRNRNKTAVVTSAHYHIKKAAYKFIYQLVRKHFPLCPKCHNCILFYIIDPSSIILSFLQK